jgi:hypothetical protein
VVFSERVFEVNFEWIMNYQEISISAGALIFKALFSPLPAPLKWAPCSRIPSKHPIAFYSIMLQNYPKR